MWIRSGNLDLRRSVDDVALGITPFVENLHKHRKFVIVHPDHPNPHKEKNGEVQSNISY